ncbi:MAG: DUF6114 domain-containing protein [Jatrophihabitans sp.]|uniref:DUF6114 domain-containing protein n=1 Tax=Jatrophihabitans sp. TaxID=1932789 RepID=UPI003F7EB2F8
MSAPEEESVGIDALLAEDGGADPAEEVPAARPSPRPRSPQFDGSRLHRARLGFRRWRRTRPFWAGLWCLIGATIIAYGPFTVIQLILISGTVVWAGILVGVLVGVMGLCLWFAPHFHTLVGILAALFSVFSLITSNFGGFLIGMLFGIIGGAMGWAWRPLPPDRQPSVPTTTTPTPTTPPTPPADDETAVLPTGVAVDSATG